MSLRAAQLNLTRAVGALRALASFGGPLTDDAVPLTAVARHLPVVPRADGLAALLTLSALVDAERVSDQVDTAARGCLRAGLDPVVLCELLAPLRTSAHHGASDDATWRAEVGTGIAAAVLASPWALPDAIRALAHAGIRRDDLHGLVMRQLVEHVIDVRDATVEIVIDDLDATAVQMIADALGVAPHQVLADARDLEGAPPVPGFVVTAVPDPPRRARGPWYDSFRRSERFIRQMRRHPRLHWQVRSDPESRARGRTHAWVGPKPRP